MKYAQLLKAIDATSQHLVGRAAAAVNQALVIHIWLIGAYIVEFEQHGEDRARYGQRLYAKLATDLSARGAHGCGERMLQQMAHFYRVYPQFGSGIPQPVVAEFSMPTGAERIRDSVVGPAASSGRQYDACSGLAGVAGEAPQAARP